MTDDDILDALQGIWGRRTDRYSELRSAKTEGLKKVEMHFIGG
jgi:cyclic pyranopterin phosphate synthase